MGGASYGSEYADDAPYQIALQQADRCAECREEHDGDGDCPACARNEHLDGRHDSFC